MENISSPELKGLVKTLTELADKNPEKEKVFHYAMLVLSDAWKDDKWAIKDIISKREYYKTRKPMESSKVIAPDVMNKNVRVDVPVCATCPNSKAKTIPASKGLAPAKIAAPAVADTDGFSLPEDLYSEPQKKVITDIGDIKTVEDANIFFGLGDAKPTDIKDSIRSLCKNMFNLDVPYDNRTSTQKFINYFFDNVINGGN